MTNSADLASCESADIKRRILELIEGASSIAISGHTSPDGDALGSVLGLGLSLMKVFPDKDIALLLADDDPVPRIYRFMEGADLLMPASAYTGNPDLFISVDVPVVERLNNSAEVLRRSAHVACFDHHPAREEFAEVSLRCVNAAACAMIIDRFLADCGITASDSIATCLLCGLVTDTGRFQYQNADAAAFHAASRLVAHGADPARVALEVYQSMRVEFLHLKSIVMGRIKTVAHGRVAYSYAYVFSIRTPTLPRFMPPRAWWRTVPIRRASRSRYTRACVSSSCTSSPSSWVASRRSRTGAWRIAMRTRATLRNAVSPRTSATAWSMLCAR